jgi:ribonuclease P protein component
MLERRHRLTSSAGFSTATRRGRRAGTRTLVVHLAAARPDLLAGADLDPRVGFVVSRAVGGSVVRTRVKRRLRHLVRERVDWLPAGTVLVVRALPLSAGASSAALGRDLDAALSRVGITPPAGISGPDGITGRSPVVGPSEASR